MHWFEKEAHNDVCKQGDGLLGMANNFSQENNGLRYFLRGNSHFYEQYRLDVQVCLELGVVDVNLLFINFGVVDTLLFIKRGTSSNSCFY